MFRTKNGGRSFDDQDGSIMPARNIKHMIFFIIIIKKIGLSYDFIFYFFFQEES